MPRNNVSAPMRVIILLAIAMCGLIACSLMMLVTGFKIDHITDMYPSIVLQDVLAFIVPAVAAMAICFVRPFSVMGLTSAPSWKGIVVCVLMCVVSLPAMNWLVKWNEGINLPESLADVEAVLRSMEDTAQAVTRGMLTGGSVGSLLLNLFVVAFMAGISEEMFFRGAMLKMITPDYRRAHFAIWVVAVVFSVFHMQFYGFVPRVLLGAWFGYLLWWTRSLWVPIIAHALNNSIVVVASWLDMRGIITADEVDAIGVPADGAVPWLALGSAAVTIAVVVIAHKWLSHESKQLSNDV